MSESFNIKEKFDPILAGHKYWPVVQLSKNRKAFVEKVAQESFKNIKALKKKPSELIEELELTRHKEKLRIKQNPWKVDPEDDAEFWKKIKKKLVVISSQSDPSGKLEDEILMEIVLRYSNEIAGNFKHRYHRFATRVVTFGFARLLNAAHSKYFSGLFRAKRTLRDKIRIRGNADQIRELAKSGTVIMVPTHFSNLDSILIGWIIQELGLPPFIYGAGLNLFNMKVFSYFMNSLGAYKVDRRKKNLIYLETLKSYSNLAIQDGCHSLFFPGGTRSRSGAIEERVKMGLLGTALEAQRVNFLKGDNKKIFIFPVVINYNFVLEAPSLIHQHLEKVGKERYYIENDKFSNSLKIIKFLLKFFTKGSDISVSIGQGIDLFGNYVDNEGKSIGKTGTYIDPKDYFLQKGEIVEDKQRDEEYTRLLSNRIIEEYHKYNEVLASHIVAFVCFQLIRKKFPDLDLYNFLRLQEDEISLNSEEFIKGVSNIQNIIIDHKNNSKLLTHPSVVGPVDELIKKGLHSVGIYHSKRPVVKNKEGNIVSEDLNLLYFYHNRLTGYNLEKHV